MFFNIILTWIRNGFRIEFGKEWKEILLEGKGDFKGDLE